MRITQAAAALGVSRDWLVTLERRGVVPPPERDLNGHRRYSFADIERLRALLILPSRARTKGGTCARG